MNNEVVCNRSDRETMPLPRKPRLEHIAMSVTHAPAIDHPTALGTKHKNYPVRLCIRVMRRRIHLLKACRGKNLKTLQKHAESLKRSNALGN